MSKFFSRLLMPGALLFALPLGLLPVCGKAELTEEQFKNALVDALKEYAEYSTGEDWAFITMPWDYANSGEMSEAITPGLFVDGVPAVNHAWLRYIYDFLYTSTFTNDLGEVVNGLDVLTNQLSHVSQKTDWISEDASLIRDLIGEYFPYLNDTYHLTSGQVDGQNVWVMNPDEMGYAVGDSLNSSLPTLLGPIQDQLDDILSKLTPTNAVNTSADEVNTTDEADFEDTSDVLSEDPYDDTSYSSPTNTDHFAGIGNPTLLDLPDPTTKLNSLASSVESLDQDSEIVFWKADSGTPADALGKVSIKLGEQAPVQWSGTFFQAGWNLLYAIFSGLAVWRFVINVHPEAGQMQGKLF